MYDILIWTFTLCDAIIAAAGNEMFVRARVRKLIVVVIVVI